MILGIIGVSGFLGSSLCAFAREQGHLVRGTSHNVQHLRQIKSQLESGLVLALDAPCPVNFFIGCDAVIHCQHDFSHNVVQRTIKGINAMREGIAEAGVKEQIFISSHSARSDALSEYGQIKYALEQEFLARGNAIARPGLIVGKGGLFARSIEGIRKAPFIPLPDAGCAETVLIGISDLCTALLAMLGKSQKEENLFLPVNPSLRALNQEICQRLGITARFLNVPTRWAERPLQALLRTVSTPTFMQRLATLHLNESSPIHQSTLLHLVPQPKAFPEVLDEAFA